MTATDAPGNTPADDSPIEQVTPLVEAAVRLHEVFTTMVAAGWERLDALDYIAAYSAARDRLARKDAR